MVTHKARIIKREDEQFLSLELGKASIEFPLTEDKPTEVRAAFNKLIGELKSNPIKFTFEKEGEDLFQQIGDDYIKQLNGELKLVRDDLEEFEMVQRDDE